VTTEVLADQGGAAGRTAPGFPFSAVLGVDDMQLALLLNAVSPAIGGVLVRGEKGTAKSTAVRALATLLPPVGVVAGCRFACDPGRPDPTCPDGPHPTPTPTGDHVIRGDHANHELPDHHQLHDHERGRGHGQECGQAEVRAARLVELPVGAAEDRVVGSLDLERALAEGVRAFEPGLLAAAHRGVLYVDEVNLLHDHLVDLLLDAAAMGRSHVEREGVSVSHAARFLLVGTMNPEEGELRPQLLDRFGLTVEVGASRDPKVRAEVVRRRLAADADPEGFAARWQDADAEIARRVIAARALLPDVVLPDAALHQIATVCAEFDVDGMRADIVTARTAIAHAAWHARTVVTADDVRTAARLALPHRRRRDPFDAPGLDADRLDEALERAAAEAGDTEQPPPDDDPTPPDDGPDGPPSGPDGPPSGRDHARSRQLGDTGGGQAPDRDGTRPPGSGADVHDHAGNGEPEQASSEPGLSGQERVVVPRAGLRARLLTAPGIGDGVSGRRSKARTGRGRTTGARVPARGVAGAGAVHLPATIRAAAAHQAARGRTAGEPLRLRLDDVREAVREGREGNLVLFVVDASGSMGARTRMEAVKGAVLSLLTDAYQRRDKVAVIAFRDASAQTLLPATSSVEAARARLDRLPTGGRTPLAEGLLAARELLRVERLRDPKRRPLVLLLTDGRATSGDHPRERAARAAALLAATGAACVIVDCEGGPVRLGLAQRLAGQLHARYHRLDEVAVDPLAGLVRSGDRPSLPPSPSHSPSHSSSPSSSPPPRSAA
jgi:magnesium chelatase subunit D